MEAGDFNRRGKEKFRSLRYHRECLLGLWRAISPREFKAYGVVAFNSRQPSADKDRYGMICNAYVSSLLYFKDIAKHRSKNRW